MNTIADKNQLASAMATGRPFKSYIKTILGKVNVTVWDMFTNTPVGLLLEGDPRKKEENSYIDLYSEYEDVFFKRANKRHFEVGNLVEYVKKEEKRERTLEEFTDEELIEIINSPFLKLQNALNKTNSVALLFRFEGLATELEKSDKVLSAIRSRLSEAQENEAPEMPKSIEDRID